MDSLALLFAEVVIQRVDDMKKIIEHPRPPAGRESSILRLVFAMLDNDSQIPKTGLLIEGLGARTTIDFTECGYVSW